MKTKAFSTTIAMMVSASLVFGQDYAFKVLVNKGKNEIKAGNNWEPVKVGSNLKSIDELKVAENSYLGLIHVTGKPLEVKDAGKYKVADLSAKVGKGTTVLNKYTDFILSSNSQKKNNLSATGAVHRGTLGVNLFIPPSASYVYNDSITLEWATDKAGPPYEVTFTGLFGDELYKTTTSQNNISINLNDGPFAKENDIQVQVFSKKDKKESEQHTLRKLGKVDRERIKTSLNEIAPQTAEKNALNNLILAGFFEQNKLLIDAATAYHKAIKLEPTVPYYQEAYEQFLIRNGLKMVPKEK